MILDTSTCSTASSADVSDDVEIEVLPKASDSKRVIEANPEEKKESTSKPGSSTTLNERSKFQSTQLGSNSTRPDEKPPRDIASFQATGNKIKPAKPIAKACHSRDYNAFAHVQKCSEVTRSKVITEESKPAKNMGVTPSNKNTGACRPEKKKENTRLSEDSVVAYTVENAQVDSSRELTAKEIEYEEAHKLMTQVILPRQPKRPKIVQL